MNKEPERRYDGAAELAADVRRHSLGGRWPPIGQSGVPHPPLGPAPPGRGPEHRGGGGAHRDRHDDGGARRFAGLAGHGATRRVTLDPELELDPAWSPDGKMVAYAAETGDRFEVFVRPVAADRPAGQ
jgi:hypothetical protein